MRRLLALGLALGSVACRATDPQGPGRDTRVPETELTRLHADEVCEIFAGSYGGLFVLLLRSASRSEDEGGDRWLGDCDVRRWIDRNGNGRYDPGEPLDHAGREDAGATSVFYRHAADRLADEDGPEWIEIDYVVRGSPRKLGPLRLR